MVEVKGRPLGLLFEFGLRILGSRQGHGRLVVRLLQLGELVVKLLVVVLVLVGSVLVLVAVFLERLY